MWISFKFIYFTAGETVISLQNIPFCTNERVSPPPAPALLDESPLSERHEGPALGAKFATGVVVRRSRGSGQAGGLGLAWLGCRG